jgi:hypothetical protein
MDVVMALAILAGLIVVHEAGHFFAPTWQGIRVIGFSVGFGPVLLQRQCRGVQFALRAIHLGGASRLSPGFVFLVSLSLVLIIKDTSQLPAIQQLLSR